MATVPASPATQAAGPNAPIASTNLNLYKAAIDFMMSSGANVQPYFFAYLAGASSLTAGVTTTVALDTEILDTDSMHLSSNGFVTIVTAGVYQFTGQIQMPTGTSTHDAAIIARTQTGGGTITNIGQNDEQYATSITRNVQVVSPWVPLNAGDVITLRGFNTPGGTVGPSSGSGLNVQYNTWMSAVRLHA